MDWETWKNRYTADELLTASFPPSVSLDKRNLLPARGLATLNGLPKCGKSWLALDLAIEVSQKGEKVIYLALEDYAGRMQDRLVKLGAPTGLKLIFIFQFLVPNVLTLLEKDSDSKLVVIDPFERVLPGKIDRNSAKDLTPILDDLQHWAFDHEACVLVVDHLRKEESQNSMKNISGSFAKVAAADRILILQKTHGQKDYSLIIIGRDIEERILRCHFNSHTFRWEIQEGDPILMDLLNQKGPLSAPEIAQILREDESNIRKKLNKLVGDGILRKIEYMTEKGLRIEYTSKTCLTSDTCVTSHTSDTCVTSSPGGSTGKTSYGGIRKDTSDLREVIL